MAIGISSPPFEKYDLLYFTILTNDDNCCKIVISLCEFEHLHQLLLIFGLIIHIDASRVDFNFTCSIAVVKFLDQQTLEVDPINWPLSVTPSVRPSFPVMIFGHFSQTALRIYPIFCMSVEYNRVYRWSQMLFLKIFLIPDDRGFSVETRRFLIFLAFSQRRLKWSSKYFAWL